MMPRSLPLRAASDRDPGRALGGACEAAPLEHAPELNLREIIAEHAPHVWRMVRSLGVHEADVDDACQDVFVIVHRKLAEFEHRSALRSWIFGIAFNVVRDYRKKAYRKHERLVDDLPLLAAAADQERAVAERQAFRKLGLILDALSEDQRRIFVLFEIERMSMRDIAALLECPLQTAYSRLDVARDIVKRRLTTLQRREAAR